MGTQRPYLTNTQAAFRYYHEDFMRRLRERAHALWGDGYRVAPTERPGTFLVYREGEATENGVGDYAVCPAADTCSCPFFQKQVAGELLNDDGEIVPCKHLLGMPELVREEMDYWAMLRDYGNPHNQEVYAETLQLLTEAWASVGK